MKHTRTFLSGFIAAALALAFVSSATAQSSEGAAKVVRVQGSARYSLGNNVWQPLKVGDILRPGSTIQTDRESGSYVDIVLGDGRVPVSSGVISPVSTSYLSTTTASRPIAQQNTLRLYEDTVLGLDKLSAIETGADLVTDTQLDLKSGHILGNVKKLTGASRYEVKIPNGVAGIRGTVYHLWADGRLIVSTGTVVLSVIDSQGNTKTRVVNAGYEYNPRTDQIIQASPADIRALETAGLGVFGAGTVYVNTVLQNPGQILSPITPSRIIGTEVSPTDGGTGGETAK